jgi:hypothetical protein
VLGAIAAGIEFFAGYPITPASEIMEYLARLMPMYDGTWVQAEDEIAAIGCPDLVTLQENVTSEIIQRSVTEFVGPLDDTVALIEARLPALAALRLQLPGGLRPGGMTTSALGRGTDEELILSRYS